MKMMACFGDMEAGRRHVMLLSLDMTDRKYVDGGRPEGSRCRYLVSGNLLGGGQSNTALGCQKLGI